MSDEIEHVTSVVLCVETGLPPNHGISGEPRHASGALHCTTARYNYAGDDTLEAPPRECVIVTSDGTRRCLKPYGHGYNADGTFMQLTPEGAAVLIHELQPGQCWAELIVNGADLNAAGGTAVEGTGEL